MPSKTYISVTRQVSFKHCSGQALIEFALISLMLITFLFGIIDFSRAILIRQVLANLSREGANLASRGTTFSDTLNAVVVSANPLTIEGRDGRGCIILTKIGRNSNGNLVITEQDRRGAKSSSSKVGVVGGTPTLPDPNIPAVGQQSLIVAEVFYEYTAVTPVGKLLGAALPAQLYDVSYF